MLVPQLSLVRKDRAKCRRSASISKGIGSKEDTWHNSRGVEQRKLAGFIIQRSRVRIPSPLPNLSVFPWWKDLKKGDCTAPVIS